VTKASEDTLDSLHNLVADSLIEEIRSYRCHVGEDGKLAPITLPPALLAQAIKFLKDNGIDSPVRAKKLADTLAGKMPDFDPEDADVVAMRRTN